MRIIAIAFLWLGLLGGAARAQEAGSGWLGADIKDLTKQEADMLGWEAPRGAKLVKPVPGGPAEAAGLQPDDILVSLDSVEIENVNGFNETVRKKAAGTEVKLAIIRAGREKRLSLRLGEWPAQLAAAKPAADEPLPVLDTGGHMAPINSIAFTPDGKQLVSASSDKTIRVWDWRTGKTERTIRGEAALGEAGQVFAIALSPDGTLLAAAGWFPGNEQESHAIRLYDFASGKLTGLLKGHEHAVHGLAFSPDGTQLISGSFDRTAILWDVATRKARHRLVGHTGQIWKVGFTPDGARAVTGSYDRDLRLWSVANGALLKTMQGHGHQVRSLAIAANGTIASGDLSGEIRLWDGGTGAFLKTLANQKTPVVSLRFNPDGSLLLTGTATLSGPQACRVFDLSSGNEVAAYQGHDNLALATAISPDGRWAATGGGDNSEVHVWDLRTGERRLGPDGTPLSLRGTGRPVYAAGFSADSHQIGWGTSSAYESHGNRGPLQFALKLASPEGVLHSPQPLDPAAIVEYQRTIARHGTLSLIHRGGSYYGYNDATLDVKEGQDVKVSIERGSTDGFRHLAYSFSPNGGQIVSAGQFGALTAYALNGDKQGDFIGHEGDVLSVAPSPNGRYLLSGSQDQTLRLWNLKSRELLVTIFRGEDGEWVMWTPQGFYAASGPGAELIGWQINHGPEHEAEYVTAAQLRTHLNRPDVVARAIQLASAKEAVKEAHGADFKLADLLKKPVPRLRILSPAADATLKGGHVQLTVELAATPDPVKLIPIQVNGRQIAEKLPPEGVAGFAPGKLTFDVPLAKGANKIAIAAVNDTGETVSSMSLTHEGEGDLDRRGTLYILAIGVDKYPNLPGNNLRYAGADAKMFADAMERRAGKLHERVVKRVLVNGGAPADAPTAANIIDALDLLRRANQNDTVMLFVSGHGINDGPNYQFAPTDAAYGEDSLLRQSSVVPWYAFQERLTGANGRRILFLDTCHSGNAFNPRLLSDSYEANIMVYSSARADQDALEDETLGGGHGLFTYALVEGVNGGARNGAGEVRAEGLRNYLKSEVQSLAAKLQSSQEPQYFRARDAENYALARP